MGSPEFCELGMAAHARGWRKCGNHVGMATHTQGQGRNFDGFGGVALRQENEPVLAQKPGFCAAKTEVLRSKTPVFAQPARRLSAI